MFVLSVLEAPNNKTHSLCVQIHLAIKLFLILILILIIVYKKIHFQSFSFSVLLVKKYIYLWDLLAMSEWKLFQHKFLFSVWLGPKVHFTTTEN